MVSCSFKVQVTKLLQKQTHVFDRAHFTVSVDPMRVVTVPNTVNAKTGLICRFIGSPYVLERLAIPDLLKLCRTFPSYPKILESSGQTEGSNGSMKSSAKNMVRAA